VTTIAGLLARLDEASTVSRNSTEWTT